jgi:proline dehydrogenase
MLREALFRLSQQKQLRDMATHNGLARKMAARFVAGETLPEAIDVVRQINARGMTATLDHLGENVASQREALEAAATGIEIMEVIARSGVRCNASLKLTQLGLDISMQLAIDNMAHVLDQATACNNFIRIDMEGSEYVERTLQAFFLLHERYKNVGTVIQSYLYRSRQDLERLINANARVRLVKGAYLEPVTVAYQRKEDVDDNYIQLMQMLLSRGNYPAIATHDSRMIEAAKRYARNNGIDPSRFEFQMLYGVRRDLQTELVAQGYRMRVYVPYGTSWYPYLMRRMAERPANVMFVLGNIAREASSKQS